MSIFLFCQYKKKSKNVDVPVYFQKVIWFMFRKCILELKVCLENLEEEYSSATNPITTLFENMFGDSANNGFQLIYFLLSWSSITLSATIVFITPISQGIVSYPFETKWCMNISLWHFVLYNPFI
jgi:hypothetical protein